jgi:CheY-like chemotaxis protein
VKTPKPSILLIQSDAAAARRFHRAVGATGYRGTVRVLRRGQEAREYLRKLPSIPTVIVCDLDLDGMSGFDVLPWVREQPRLATVPFVFLAAALPRAEDVERARLLGVAVSSGDGEFVRAIGPIVALGDGTGGAPRLKEIRVGSSSENSDISSKKRYRVRVGSAWHEGAFRKYWFGWKFEDFGASGIQLNLIDEVYEIQPASVPKRRYARSVQGGGTP